MKLKFRIWTFSRRLTALLFLAILALGGRGHFGWFKGSAMATQFGTWIRFADPLAALEMGLSSGGFSWPMTKAVAILVLVALIFGPVFCDWICPLGLILDVNNSLRRWRQQVFSNSSEGRRCPQPLRPWRLFFLGLVIGFATISSMPIFTPLSPIQTVVSLFVSTSTLAFGIVLSLLLIEQFFSRVWCRSFCPLGALYALLGRLAPLKNLLDPNRSSGSKACPQGCVHCPVKDGHACDRIK